MDFSELHSEYCVGGYWEFRDSKQMASGCKFTTWMHGILKEHWLAKPIRFLQMQDRLSCSSRWTVRDFVKVLDNQLLKLEIPVNMILPPPLGATSSVRNGKKL